MRIDGTRRYGSVGAKGRALTSDSGASFDLGLAGPTIETPSTSAAAPAAHLDSLISLQLVEDSMQRRKRGFTRGRSMLDALDKIKVSLLGGSIAAGDLSRLLSAVGGRERDSEDPQLEGLLDEIELRARVEMAKLRQHHRFV